MKKIDPTLAGRTEGDHFGLRMRKAREAANLSRKDAAAEIGISVAQLGKIERGSVGMVSDPNTLVRAGRAYGVSDVWLYAGSMAGARFVPDYYLPVAIRRELAELEAQEAAA
jgi:transcriptional regulator with XRE-family HTH domain